MNAPEEIIILDQTANKGTGAGGANTNVVGKSFEQSTSITKSVNATKMDYF